MKHGLVWAYLTLLGFLACYGVYRYHLLAMYYRVRSRRPTAAHALEAWPRVTIQIPVYNERYVIERAIQSACEVDYPQDRLEVQILDDSTDETSDMARRAIERYRRQGIAIQHVQRASRKDFKAGALAEALTSATGEYIAVFDADFIIPKDFLRRTVPFFADASVGMVQVRWGHVNSGYSMLTQAQAVLLDGHFAIEQVARHQSGRFFNFNGTGGIWRARTIIESGNWQPDTLTEDLDLSYRAQLAGWHCVYLPDLVAPAELPVEMNAFKAQQYRWTKGSIQTAKKLLPSILSSPLPWRLKSEAFFHLSSFFNYPLALLAGLGTPPILLGVLQLPNRWYVDLLWFLLLAIPGAFFYLCAQRELHADWAKRVSMIPWVLAVGVGLLLNNSRAVLDGLFGRDAEFIRTTKFGVQGRSDQWQDKSYRAPLNWSVWVELLLAIYFGFGCWVALQQGLYSALPSVGLFFVGFAYVGGLSLWQRMPMPTWIVEPSGSRTPVLPESSPTV
jgi:cellulose synthase/poly-beta-1,6-N-acetylglucosamine synthase-like glycosyltransferase